MTFQQAEQTSIGDSSSNRGAASDVVATLQDLVNAKGLAQAEILHLSLEQQRALYDRHSGRNPWHQTHIQLADIGRNENRERQQSLHEQSWAAIPSRSFKMFQQLFSTQDLFVVPGNPKNLIDHSIPGFPLKELNPEWYSVLGCQVDPQRLSTAIIERFKLPKPDFTLNSEGKDPYASTILALKYLWECLRPLPQSNHRNPNCRMLVVREPHLTVQQRYQDAARELGVTHNPDLHGTVVYIKGAHSGQESSYRGLFRKLHVQHFSSTYDALRKTIHEQEGYSTERKLLGPLYQRWQHFRESELPLWISAKRERELVEHAESTGVREQLHQQISSGNQRILTSYRELLGDSLEFLRHSTNSEKRLMATRVSEMLEQFDHDQERRINPNPAILRITSNQALLALRSEEIENKDMFNAQDQFLLSQTIQTGEAVLNSIHQKLEQNADIVHGKRRLFTAQRLTQQEIYRETASFLRDLALPIDQVRGLATQPFLSFARAVNEGHAALVSALHNGNRDLAEDALLNIHATTLAHRAHVNIQSVLRELCRPVIRLEELAARRENLQRGSLVTQLFKQPVLFQDQSSTIAVQALNKTVRETSEIAARQITEALTRPELPREALKESLRALAKLLIEAIQKR